MIRLLTILIICLSYDPDIINAQTFPKQELKAGYTGSRKNLWVFIMAGQSNMAGRGIVEPADTIPSERIFSLNKEGELIYAKEPLHFYEPSLRGLDCGLSFARVLIEKIPENISVLIIPAAVGGSSISQWTGDSTFRSVRLLSNFRDKTAVGKKYGTLKAVLWHQGENDANVRDIPFYRERLGLLFTKFRSIAGDKNLPIILGELGTFSVNNDSWQKINEEIRIYSSGDKNTVVVKTSDLKHKGDKVHFNSEGQRTLGKRFAEAYLSLKGR